MQIEKFELRTVEAKTMFNSLTGFIKYGSAEGNIFMVKANDRY